tara:strand:- start:6141 stop:6908 length:768 start_codon:yes stop_codon:yes gene_type:complete
VNDKLQALWATKTRDDEWWSSFVTAPLAIVANYFAVELRWITPNRVTAASFLIAVAASLAILGGGSWYFLVAAVLIQMSHVLDCMDGQMARYKRISSPVGSYYDRITDQVQVALWFGAAGFAAFEQTGSVTPVFLSLIGISFYGLRGYAKYIALEIETSRNPDYPAEVAKLKHVKITAGPGMGLRANLTWLWREQHKVLAFDEGVFVFMLSAALLFDQLVPMLWIFAASQVYWGVYRSWLRGRNIGQAKTILLQK